MQPSTVFAFVAGGKAPPSKGRARLAIGAKRCIIFDGENYFPSVQEGTWSGCCANTHPTLARGSPPFLLVLWVWRFLQQFTAFFCVGGLAFRLDSLRVPRHAAAVPFLRKFDRFFRRSSSLLQQGTGQQVVVKCFDRLRGSSWPSSGKRSSN